MKFRKFASTIVQSVYSPPFYALVRSQSKGTAVKYFFKLALLLTLLVVVSSIGFVGALINFEQNAPKYMNDLGNHFPAELALTIKNGHASSNVPEPYLVPIQGDSKTTDPQFRNFVVIDTKTPFSAEQFAKYQAYAWVNRDSLFYYSNASQTSAGATTISEVRVLPLTNIPDTVIDRAYVNGLLAKVVPWLRGLAPVFALLIVGFIYIGVLFKLVYLFVLAALVWLLAKILGRGLSYGQAYVTGLYAATGGFILAGLGNAIHHSLPFLTVTVLALLVVGVNILHQPRRTS